jgi:hypothetical protein
MEMLFFIGFTGGSVAECYFTLSLTIDGCFSSSDTAFDETLYL